MATVVRWMFARKSLCEADRTCAACIAERPDVAAGLLSIAFGDFRRGDLIVDRQGLRALRDPCSAKPCCSTLISGLGAVSGRVRARCPRSDGRGRGRPVAGLARAPSDRHGLQHASGWNGPTVPSGRCFLLMIPRACVVRNSKRHGATSWRSGVMRKRLSTRCNSDCGSACDHGN